MKRQWVTVPLAPVYSIGQLPFALVGVPVGYELMVHHIPFMIADRQFFESLVSLYLPSFIHLPRPFPSHSNSGSSGSSSDSDSSDGRSKRTAKKKRYCAHPDNFSISLLLSRHLLHVLVAMLRFSFTSMCAMHVCVYVSELTIRAGALS